MTPDEAVAPDEALTPDEAVPPGMSWRVPMVGRRRDEEHRSATPLELLFDLCFVVAVAQAAAGLHHALSEGHVADGVVGFVLVFFAIWWAWMNFTWFASAFDTDDVAYRLAVLVQIAGALVFAAGVPRAFEERDFAVGTLGYVIMRLALVGLWLRAARADDIRRPAARRFALGVTVVQVAWVLRLTLPEEWQTPAFLVCAAADLAVPLWAEAETHTPWHPGHIAERYGLFTIIVLGESILASTVAIQSALDADVAFLDLATVSVGGFLVVSSMWWLYFAKDAARFLTTTRAGFIWGYGHYVIFAAAAAVGTGLAVNVDDAQHLAHIGPYTVAATVTVPAAVFVFGVWTLQWLPHRLRGWHYALPPIVAALMLGATFAPQPVLLTGALAVFLVAAGILSAREVRAAPSPAHQERPAT